tara:strand:+ start:1586 stop:2215 length:630 start_codon:yes stop_codon:yes gene_type:complete
MENSKNKIVGIIDYGINNINSVKNSLTRLNTNFKVINSKKSFFEASHYILPGVGSFKRAMQNLKKMEIIPMIKSCVINEKKNFLGICLGMQLLFDKSFEDGENDGLGLIKGEVKRLEKHLNLSVPNMGWLSPKFNKNSKLIKEVSENSFFYFVHSYACYSHDRNLSIATLQYKNEFDVIVQNKNLFGVQFHPEKSQDPGLQILKNFLNG